jgi:acetylornithine deacetylase/succinyl-diaminopimelate desuccinylase-like protein
VHAQVGVENVEVLEIPGVHPYVYGDWLHKPGAPTILLYGHHDVQPPGPPRRGCRPAFEPSERGGRLYGRGTADDKARRDGPRGRGRRLPEAPGELPCNVKFIIEGEEEIGSENLGRFLDKYKKMMAADFIVLSDTANFDTGIPRLTYQLRGIVQVDVEVQCLDHPLHSGMWGGPVPDPVQILCALIGGLQARRTARSTCRALQATWPSRRASSSSASASCPSTRRSSRRTARLVKGMKLGREGLLRRTRRSGRGPRSPSSPSRRTHPGLLEPDLDGRARALSLRTVPEHGRAEGGRSSW